MKPPYEYLPDACNTEECVPEPGELGPPNIHIFPHLLHNSSSPTPHILLLIFFSSSPTHLLISYSSPHLSLHNKYKSTEPQKYLNYPVLG